MEIPEVPEVHRAAYRWTSEELATAWRHHREADLRPAFVLLVGVFIWLLSALVLFVLFYAIPRSPGTEERPLILLCLPAYALYWTFFRNALLKWQARWALKKDPGADQMIEWEVSAKEVKYYQRGLFYTASAWKNFVKVAEAHDGFLFYMGERSFVWLPFRAFESPQAIEQTRAFAQASGLLYRKL